MNILGSLESAYYLLVLIELFR